MKTPTSFNELFSNKELDHYDYLINYVCERLSGETLLNFQKVCKKLRDQINSPNFLKNFFKNKYPLNFQNEIGNILEQQGKEQKQSYGKILNTIENKYSQFQTKQTGGFSLLNKDVLGIILENLEIEEIVNLTFTNSIIQKILIVYKADQARSKYFKQYQKLSDLKVFEHSFKNFFFEA